METKRYALSCKARLSKSIIIDGWTMNHAALYGADLGGTSVGGRVDRLAGFMTIWRMDDGWYGVTSDRRRCSDGREQWRSRRASSSCMELDTLGESSRKRRRIRETHTPLGSSLPHNSSAISLSFLVGAWQLDLWSWLHLVNFNRRPYIDPTPNVLVMLICRLTHTYSDPYHSNELVGEYGYESVEQSSSTTVVVPLLVEWVWQRGIVGARIWWSKS